MREDVFKVIYAREQMREAHLSILKMSINRGDWSWWPVSINKNLDKEKKQEMLFYFGTPIISTMKLDFIKQMDVFSKDSKLFCAAKGIEYPDNLGFYSESSGNGIILSGDRNDRKLHEDGIRVARLRGAVVHSRDEI